MIWINGLHQEVPTNVPAADHSAFDLRPIGNIRRRIEWGGEVRPHVVRCRLRDDWFGGVMRIQQIGGIGDFGKLALLRHLMQGRRLAVCSYLSDASDEVKDIDKHFDYLRRPDEFRHLAPDLFDQLVEFVGGRAVTDPLVALQTSRVLGDARLLRHKVPNQASLRPLLTERLVHSVSDANLVFLDPDNGIQGKRLTNRHVALAEIAALRLKDRVLVIGHHQSGRKAEVKYLADRMKSLGCDLVEIVRLRLVASCLYVILDQDETMAEATATFVRRWGSWAKSYRF